MKSKTYSIGDKLTYTTFCNSPRTITVTSKESDIKNGKPGFSGHTADGQPVWGYDNQIVSIERFDGIDRHYPA